MSASETVSLVAARRLALLAQGFAGRTEGTDKSRILSAVRAVNRIQLDPTAVVAPSHRLVLWSRIGPYDLGALDQLLWDERELFEYSAYIWPIEYYPLLRPTLMAQFPGGGQWADRVREWMARNDTFRGYVLDEVAEKGPLPSRSLEDRAVVPWRSAGWTTGQNVTRMVEFLAAQGEICVAARRGRERLWGVPEKVLPVTARSASMSREAAGERLLELRLSAMGVTLESTAKMLERAWSQPHLTKRLLAEGRVRRVGIDGAGPGPWLVRAEDWSTLRDGIPDPLGYRTTLLSPFDNLIHERQQTEALHHFRFRTELYVPAARRSFGYYAMPVLNEERLVGFVDPVFDHRTGRLKIQRIVLEQRSKRQRALIERSIESLAAFLGATSVDRPLGEVS